MKVHHIGHKCKKTCAILVEGQFEDDSELIFEEPEDEVKNSIVSLIALFGLQNHDIVKIAGKMEKQVLTILWDSGSTHSFIDISTAKKLGCVVEYTSPLVVTIADASKMECNSRCHRFEWQIGEHKFCSPIMILHLGGCDMVLRADLMSWLGPITFDFSMHKVEFQKDGKTICLQGLSDERMQVSMITGKQLRKLAKTGQCKGQAFLCLIKTDSEIEKCKAIPELEPLLREYKDVLQMQTS